MHGSRHPSGFGPGGVDVAGIPGFRCPHVLHVVRHKFHMISQDGDQSFLLHTHTAHHSSMSCLNCFVRQILPLAIPKWLVGGFAGALAVRLCCLATSSAEYESQLAQIWACNSLYCNCQLCNPSHQSWFGTARQGWTALTFSSPTLAAPKPKAAPASRSLFETCLRSRNHAVVHTNSQEIHHLLDV